jgi:hypothetical protein
MKTTNGSSIGMHGIFGFLAVALLTLGCGSSPSSQSSLMGPSTSSTFNASSASLSGSNSNPASSLLGDAAGFAVFAASTATNTGFSVVTGDIGLTPGSSVTGFPPGTLTGVLHINDALTARAKLNLQAFYDDLAGRACNTIAPNLNSTLAPGVYCFPSSAQLNTALVLDGRGNPNALFLFQIGSTLTTASNSSVTLINGASASNVYWQVGSSATLGTNTAFQGTIIAYSSITLTTGTSITNGRAMALNGAVTMDSNVITVPVASGGGNGGSGGHGDDDGDDDNDHSDNGNHYGHDKDKGNNGHHYGNDKEGRH